MEVISDGDSKTIAVLQESEPYGKNVETTKYECVGHVQKKLGKHLRDAKWKIAALNKVARQKLKEMQEKEKEKKKGTKNGRVKEKVEGKKDRRKAEGSRKMEEEVRDAKKGEVVEVNVIKGMFGDKTIHLLQNYYGNAIRNHVGDLDGMKRACWAVFYHQ